jgi:hypothetical protein
LTDEKARRYQAIFAEHGARRTKGQVGTSAVMLR